MRTRADILDELLVLRAQGGDTESFGLLVKRWNGRLCAMAARLTGDSEAAKDIVQEVWLGVARGLRRLDDPSGFPGWVYRIVRNKCSDWIRRQISDRRKRYRAAEDAALNATDEGGDAAAIQALRARIRELPDDQRRILTLFYLDEMPVREIALALGIPTGTVKSRLYHARIQLRQAMED